MAKLRPDLFYAFVGTGQATDLPRSLTMEYQRLTAAATAAKDRRTLEELRMIGAPPFAGRRQATVYFQCAERYQARADTAAMGELQRSLLSPPPNYSLGDEWSRLRGFMVVPPWTLYQEILSTNLATLGPELHVPVFFFQGTDDHVTPLGLAEEYFKAVQAPRKELVTLEHGGHFAVWSHAELFRTELVKRVRPLAVPVEKSGPL